MAGLDPAIHALLPRTKTWMPATSAGMTANVRHILENAALLGEFEVPIIPGRKLV